MKSTPASRLAILSIGLATLIGFAPSAQAADYYVSNDGKKSNDGRTPKTPVTLEKVLSTAIQPGDNVFFKGGEIFNGTISTTSSGTSNAPITFKSYEGKAKIVATEKNSAIYLNNNHYLLFRNIQLSAPGGAGVLLSGTGEGSTDITLDELIIQDCAWDGINSANNADARILLSNSQIMNIQGCGVTFHASDFKVINNTIKNTGLNIAPPWPMHGIYAKGPKPVIIGNIITDFQSTGVSLRYNSSHVESNRIEVFSRGERGICYFQENNIPGTTKILNNRIIGIPIHGIGIDNGSTTANFGGDATTSSSTESFMICGNNITMKLGSKYVAEGIRLYKVVAATVMNNTIDGTFNLAYNAYTSTSEKYSESDNNWITKNFAEPILRWNGSTPMSLSEFRKKSKQGKGDSTNRTNVRSPSTQLGYQQPRIPQVQAPSTNMPPQGLTPFRKWQQMQKRGR